MKKASIQNPEQLAYDEAVERIARTIVDEVKDLPFAERKEGFQTRLDEAFGTEPYVVNDELNIHTLLYSAHPSAGIANGTGPVRSKDVNNNSKTAFPFKDFAEAAMTVDVQECALAMLEEEEISLDEEDETVVIQHPTEGGLFWGESGAGQEGWVGYSSASQYDRSDVISELPSGAEGGVIVSTEEICVVLETHDEDDDEEK